MMKKEEMRSDIAALEAMTDDDIDCSDLPEFSQEELDAVDGIAKGPGQEFLYLSIDRPVLELYRKTGRNYRVLINNVLKEYAVANIA